MGSKVTLYLKAKENQSKARSTPEMFCIVALTQGSSVLKELSKRCAIGFLNRVITACDYQYPPPDNCS